MKYILPLMFICIATLAGCGYKGALTMPAPPDATASDSNNHQIIK